MGCIDIFQKKTKHNNNNNFLKKFTKCFYHFSAKSRVEISRRIKLNCAREVMSTLRRLLYLLALDLGDLLKLV